MTQTVSGTQITVRRPSGQVETILQAGKFFTQPVRERMIAETRKAGRGDILSFDEIVPTASLESQRRTLVATIQGTLDSLRDVTERAHARQDARTEIVRREWDSKVAAARQALADFDTAHPEIAAAIRTEQQDRTARFLCQD